MTPQTLEVRAHDPLGATVTGLRLQDASHEQIEALCVVLAEHGVAVLPHQDLDDAQFTAVLRRFGELTFTTGETPVPGHADLNVITNVGRSTPPRSSFHVDSSYLSRPPTYTALRAVTIPASGGETLFTDQYRAYDSLDASLRDLLRGRRVRHVVTGVELGPQDESEALHPVFSVHPISGRTAVYLSTPARCVAVEGLDEATGRDAVERLYAHSTRPENTFRHAWAPGDVVIWDNRCVLHRADHSRVEGDRVMHRGMVVDAVQGS